MLEPMTTSKHSLLRGSCIVPSKTNAISKEHGTESHSPVAVAVKLLIAVNVLAAVDGCSQGKITFLIKDKGVTTGK
jgi:hypothetical protein